MRRVALLVAVLPGLACGMARADDFSLPGLSNDSDAYAALLGKRFPVSGTPLLVDGTKIAAEPARREATWHPPARAFIG